MKKFYTLFIFIISLFTLTSCKDNSVYIDKLLNPTKVSESVFSKSVIDSCLESHVSVKYKGQLSVISSSQPHYDYTESDGVIFKEEVGTYYVLTMQPSFRLTDNIDPKNYLIFFNEYSIPATAVKKLVVDPLSDNGLDRLTDFMDMFVLTFTLSDKNAFENLIGRKVSPITSYSNVLSKSTNSILDIAEANQHVFAITHDTWTMQDIEFMDRISSGTIAAINQLQEIINPYKRSAITNNSLYTTYVQLDLIVNDGNFGSPIFDVNGAFLGIAVNKWTMSSGINVDRMSYMLPSFVFESCLDSKYIKDFS